MAMSHRRTMPFRPVAGWRIARPAPQTVAVIALIVANVGWGGSAVASKTAMAHLPPMTLATLRVGVAMVVLQALLRRQGGRPASGRGPALLGLTGVALFCATQNLGLRHATAGTTALLNGAIPVLTMLLAVAFLGERMPGRRLIGVLVSFAGIILLVLSGSSAGLGAAAAGNLLPLASAASFAAYAVLGRRMFGAGGALAIVAGSTRYGFCLLLPFAVIEGLTGGVTRPTLTDGLLVVYLGAGCSALAFVLCGYGLARMEAGHAATFGNLKPLVGIVLAVGLLHEPLAAGQIGGGALVLIGVVVATWKAAPALPRATGRSIRSAGQPTTSTPRRTH